MAVKGKQPKKYLGVSFFFVGSWPKTGIFCPNRQIKAWWNRFFLTKKQEQIGEKEIGCRRRPIFFWPFFQPKQEENGGGEIAFLPPKAGSNPKKKNHKKAASNHGDRPKKAQASRAPNFGHFGQLPTKKNSRLSSFFGPYMVPFFHPNFFHIFFWLFFLDFWISDFRNSAKASVIFFL